MPPTIAEMMIQSGLDFSKQTVDFGGAITRGAQLAQTVESMRNQREQLELQKQEHFMQKIAKVGSLYETAGKLEGKGQKFMYDKAIPNTIKALKLDEYFPESTHAILTSSPSAVPYLISQVRQDPKKLDAILKALQDPSGEQLAQMYPDIQVFGATEALASDAKDNVDQLVDAQKYSMTEEGKTYRSQYVAGATTARAREARDEAGDVELSKATNDHYALWEGEGGGAGVDANLKLLKEVRTLLQEKKMKTGTIGAFIPTDTAKKFAVPDLVALTNKAKKAIQSSLRATLGPQFTQVEGERIENRTLDPQLDSQANIDSLTAEIDKIENTRRRADGLFRRYVKGYGEKAKPRKSSDKVKDEVDAANAVAKKTFKDFTPAEQELLINNYAKKYGVSPEEARKALEVR